jgi:alkylation response protein AidB-like acyl-CoA dehydrogenase
VIRWSPEQQAVRDALRDFVQKSVEPHRRQLESGDLPPYDILRELIRTFGLDEIAEERFQRRMDQRAGPLVPGRVAPTRWPWSCCPSSNSPVFAWHGTAMGVSANLTPGAILNAGTPEQKARWAPDLMTMRKVGAWALTETGSGSDVFGGMRSSARRQGDDFVLTPSAPTTGRRRSPGTGSRWSRDAASPGTGRPC